MSDNTIPVWRGAYLDEAIRHQAEGRVYNADLRDGDRLLTLGEARRALVDTPESAYKIPLDAAQQAKTGCLFVLDGLTRALTDVRLVDAVEAIRSGALRAPFPDTFVLVKLDGLPGVYLLSIFDRGFIADEAKGCGLTVWAFRPSWLSDTRVRWLGLPSSKAPFHIGPVSDVVLSLIADSRSPVTRVEADDKLQAARRKHGKAPIPPYWKVEPPKPTVLVLIITSAIEIAVKAKGTHASPRPHDRRGHPRHLKKGDRTVWVRECRINALSPHLTRGRAFYDVRL